MESEDDKIFCTAHQDNIPYIEPDRFGKDHFSTLLFIETRCVDHGGYMDGAAPRMRWNPRRHRLLGRIGRRGNSFTDRAWDPKYATRLKGGDQPYDGHDDWDCVEDMIKCGWVDIDQVKRFSRSDARTHTGLRTLRLRLTEEGKRVAAELRAHRMDGGSVGKFELRP